MQERLPALALTVGLAAGIAAGEAPNAFANDANHKSNEITMEQPGSVQHALNVGPVTLNAARGADGKLSLSYAPTASEASTGYLNDVGPALPNNLKDANAEVQSELSEEGPNSGLAIEIAKGLGITTAAGRAKYITPGNISLGKKIIATNREWPGDVGLQGQTPISIPNPHPTSVAYTIDANKVPNQSSRLVSKLPNGEFQLKTEVIRGLCVNALSRAIPARSNKRFSNSLNVDVTFGVDTAVSAFAQSTSESISTSGATETCNGATVTAGSQSSAESSAIETALANIKESEHFTIQGKGVTAEQFQAQFNAEVSAADQAISNAVSSSSSNVSINCPPVLPPQPPIIPQTPGTPGIAIKKAFVASYNSDGSLYSDLATKHRDTDEWQITVENTGNESLTDQYTDTPPEGEVNINDTNADPAQPFGFSVEGNGLGYFGDTLPAGGEEIYTVYTHNVDVPCYTNVVDTIDVIGTDSNGKQVTAEAQAYTKEENTGPDCINEAPPVTGPGQPLPSN